MNYTSSIWISETESKKIWVIDQQKLPFWVEELELQNVFQIYSAIKNMIVRGAPLIGVTAAYGMYFAVCEAGIKDFEEHIKEKAEYLKSSRPTAVNLSFVVDEVVGFILENKNNPERRSLAFEKANSIRQREIEFSEKIGENGLVLIKDIFNRKKLTVNILTHCNAGWLACVEWGSALAPVYKAHLQGIPVHVWVDETRPRNQGAKLTAFELTQAGIPHTIIPDNTGGHLMQHGMVDMVIVGSDRTTITGDVANKIGTYLKALAAFDNNVPFYVALPSSTIDWKIEDGLKEIPIEQRDSEEVTEIEGWNGSSVQKVRIISDSSRVANYGFDVTPARLVTGLITERGICKASREGIQGLFNNSFKKNL